MLNEITHHLLTLKLFQICIHFFLLLNTNVKIILKNMCNRRVDGPLDFHSIFFHTMEVNGDHEVFGYQYSKYLLCSTEERHSCRFESE